MPNRRGPHTYKGYKSPNTDGWPEPIQNEVKKVYGAYREKHPGEDHRTKARGAAIAWTTAERKFPKLVRQHRQDQRRIARGTREEMKEHKWAGRKVAAHLATDHVREDKQAYVIRSRVRHVQISNN